MTLKKLQDLAKDVGTTYSGKSKQKLLNDIQKVKNFNTQLNKHKRVFKCLDAYLGEGYPPIELKRFLEFYQKLLKLQRLYNSKLNKNTKDKLDKLIKETTLRIDWIQETILGNPEIYGFIEE